MKLTQPQIETLQIIGRAGIGVVFGKRGPSLRRLIRKRAIVRVGGDRYERYKLTPQGLNALAAHTAGKRGSDGPA